MGPGLATRSARRTRRPGEGRELLDHPSRVRNREGRSLEGLRLLPRAPHHVQGLRSGRGLPPVVALPGRVVPVEDPTAAFHRPGQPSSAVLGGEVEWSDAWRPSCSLSTGGNRRPTSTAVGQSAPLLSTSTTPAAVALRRSPLAFLPTRPGRRAPWWPTPGGGRDPAGGGCHGGRPAVRQRGPGGGLPRPPLRMSPRRSRHSDGPGDIRGTYPGCWSTDLTRFLIAERIEFEDVTEEFEEFLDRPTS